MYVFGHNDFYAGLSGKKKNTRGTYSENKPKKNGIFFEK